MTAPDRIDPNVSNVPPVQPTPPARPGTSERVTTDGRTFGDILRTKVAETVSPAVQQEVAAPKTDVTIRWSAHAAARLKQRGITLSDTQLGRLESAVDRASAKGSRDSLVLMDDTALVVSVKNRTVITALGRDQAKDNVFTNIDSAVIA